MAEVWEQALVLSGIVLLAMLGGLAYYLTSDSYRKSKKMAQLGHEASSFYDL